MHMTLSIFPQLLTYSLVAPLIIRLTLGVIFLHFGTSKIRHPIAKVSKGLGILEIIIGIALIIGIFTQVAAAFVAVIMIVQLVEKLRTRRFLTDGVNYYLILFIMAVALLFSGAGYLGIDSPIL